LIRKTEIQRTMTDSRRKPPSDIALFEGVRLGDRASFEELYHRYYRRLYGYLLRMTRRPELIEEGINEVMFIVWKDAQRFRGSSRLSTWIFGIAYRQAMKLLQRTEREERQLPAEAVETRMPEDPSAGLDRRQVRWSLDNALAELSPEHRAVVELTFFHDHSYREIAVIVGCPVNTVKTRMFHARRRLRRILQSTSLGSLREVRA